MISNPIRHARTLRAELSPHWGRAGTLQWGIVTAVHPTASPIPTVDVKLDGSSTVTPGLTYLESYNPLVNDLVVIARMQGPAQTSRVVLCTYGPAGAWAESNPLKVGVVTLGAGTTTFNLPSPQLWGSIRLEFAGITNSSAGVDNVLLYFNTDTTGGDYFATTWDQANNGAIGTTTNNTLGGIAWTCLATGTTLGSNYAGSGLFEIIGINSGSYKRIMGQTSYGDSATNQMSMRWGLWKSTAAITTLNFLSTVGPGTNTLGGTVTVLAIP